MTFRFADRWVDLLKLTPAEASRRLEARDLTFYAFMDTVEDQLAAGSSIPGPAGAPGANGKTLLSGSGAPGSGTGAEGDFYIDTTADAIYGPKTAGAWGSATSLIGPTGPAGPAGSYDDIMTAYFMLGA